MDSEPGTVSRSGAAEQTPASDEIETTRAEIEHTRVDLAETLEALKDKLNPQALMDQARDRVQDVASNLAEKAKDTVHNVTADVMEQTKTTVHTVVEDVSSHAQETAKGAVTGALGGVVDEAKDVVGSAVSGVVDTAKGAGNTVLDTMKRNPLPTALLALGAAWLYFKNRDQQPSSKYSRPASQGRGQEADNGKGIIDQIKDTAGQAVDAAGNAMDAAKDKAGQAVDAARHAVGGAIGTAQQTGLSLLDTIQQNPIPAVATALGVTWLYMKNQDDNKALRYRHSSADDSGPGLIDQVKGTAGQAVDAVGGAVNAAKDKVGQTVGAAKEKAGQVTQQAKDRVVDLGTQAMEHTRRAGNTAQRSLQENPLPIGMVALGVGAAIGLLVPETERENQMMGQTRDRLVEKAQNKAQDVAARVQAVAEESLKAAQDTAKHEAQSRGLTSE